MILIHIENLLYWLFTDAEKSTVKRSEAWIVGQDPVKEIGICSLIWIEEMQWKKMRKNIVMDELSWALQYLWFWIFLWEYERRSMVTDIDQEPLG